MSDEHQLELNLDDPVEYLTPPFHPGVSSRTRTPTAPSGRPMVLIAVLVEIEPRSNPSSSEGA